MHSDETVLREPGAVTQHKKSSAMRASNWRPCVSNSLQGFFDLDLASGLRLHELSLHEQNGKRWIGMPGKPQIDSDGRHRRDAAGKRLYTPVVKIPSKERRECFQAAALAAVDRLIGHSREEDH